MGRPALRIFMMMIAMLCMNCTGNGVMDNRQMSALSELIDKGESQKALSEISLIDRSRLTAKENAYLTLLQCRAYRHENIPPASPEQIIPIIEALGNDEHNPLLAEAKYYLASAYLNNSNYPNAVIEASEATSSPSADSTIVADCYVIIALSHRETHNSTLELAFAEMAIEAAPMNETANNAYTDALIHNRKYEECLSFIDSKASVFPSLRRKATIPALALRRYDLAKDIFESLEANSTDLTVEERLNKALLTVTTGGAKSKDLFEDQDSDYRYSLNELKLLAELHTATGNLKEAEKTRLQMLDIQDSMISRLSESKIYEDLYNIEHAKSQASEFNARRSRTILISAIAGSVMIIILLSVLIFYRKAIERKRMAESENRILALNDELTRGRSEREYQDKMITAMRKDVDRLFKEHYESVEMAANLLLDTSMSKNSDKRITEELSRKVSKCRDPKFLSTLESTVNEFRNGAIDRLRKQIAGISDQEMTIILYSAAGLSSRVICLLTDQSASALYNKKYRIKKKILASDAADREEFVDMIS